MSGVWSTDRRRLWVDVGLACVLPTVQLALLVGTGALRPWGPTVALTIALILVQGFPLAVRRSYPVGVFVVILAGNTAYYALGLPPTGYDLGLALALYSVAERRDTRSLTAYGVVVAETLAMKLLGVGPYWSQAPWFLVVYLWVFFGAAWLWGAYQRVRAQRVHDLLVQAERERVAAADAAVREERTRIARELHDVIAHHLSLMVIQAGGARRLVEDDPRRAREALTVIEEYGRRGLEAMPGLLRALRTDSETERVPSPQLSDVHTLVAELRRSGQTVTLRVEGHQSRLPDDVELSAFRIIQEALTNVFRHAGPHPSATVRLTYEPEALTVEVSDDGPGLGGEPSRQGHGLAGMRERVALLGGTWELRDAPTGGCLVRARFPHQGPVS